MEESLNECVSECVELAYSWLEDDWAEATMNALAFQDYPTRYGVGSYGEHELCHTLYMMRENFEHFVMNHPSMGLNKDDFLFASIVNQMLTELYQKIALRQGGENNECSEPIESTNSADTTSGEKAL